MVDNNDRLLREVDEELRRDQLEKLWKQHGNKFLMLAVAFVLAVGGVQAWKARSIAAAESAGATFEDARRLIAEGKPADASKSLETLAKGGPSGYATLALLQLGAADLKAGRTAEALASFDKLGKTEAAEPILRDYARLQAAALRLGEADFTEMQNRLNAIMGDKNPWRASARELFGMAAMKAGKNELARGTFQQLLGERNTPPGVAERARIAMAQLIEAELAAPPAAPAAKPDAGMAGAPAAGGAPAAPAPAQTKAGGDAKPQPSK